MVHFPAIIAGKAQQHKESVGIRRATSPSVQIADPHTVACTLILTESFWAE